MTGTPDLSVKQCGLAVSTAKWGDVIEPFFDPVDLLTEPSFLDIAAMVNTFTNDPAALIRTRALTLPNTPYPAQEIDFKDIATIVRAFVGDPCTAQTGVTGPCTCLLGQPCGTSCNSDSECPDGLCIDGFCTGACGRCTP